jgi:hypothetical protein
VGALSGFILGNEQGTIGTWEQVAAVMELGALKNKRPYVVQILSLARPLYVARNASRELIDAIDAVLNESRS